MPTRAAALLREPPAPRGPERSDRNAVLVMRKGQIRCALLAVLAAAWCGGIHAAPATALDDVQVTATRQPEPLDRVPAALSVIGDTQLQCRDAWTLATALELVPGVEAPAGGDAGPSSAVPSFWGLHEFDAFLLVVDQVPWGGAFNPMITTLNLNDVQRVEVLKGSAPVLFGATAFVGVVQLVHYPAGEASQSGALAVGSHGSVRGAAALVLPSTADLRQSLAVDAQRQGYADARERVANGNVLYRAALDIGAARLNVDADITVVRDLPPSPVLRSGRALTALTPVDANFNPANARIDQNEYHLSLAYVQPLDAGRWETLASLAHSDIRDVRGFLHPDLSGTADTQDQDRHIDDAYVDSHLSGVLGKDTGYTLGADLLYGLGRQTTRNGNSAYTVPLDGSVLPPGTDAGPANEVGLVRDRRAFAGQYAQLDWKPDAHWDVIAGLRLNETDERKTSSDLILSPASPLAAQQAGRSLLRLTESLGASFRAWEDGRDEAVFYADLRKAFKPAAVDFGPDYTPQVLQPETALSVEGGIKGALDEGRLSYQAALFRLNFRNLVVASSSGALVNAGGERLQGLEAELRYAPAPELALALNAALHDARYTQYLFFDPVAGAPVAVDGRQLPLSPRSAAAAGLLYTPRQGLGGTVLGRYVGRRFLDEQNTAAAGGYLTLDATLSVRVAGYELALEGSNLTDRRPPVTASEFGSQSFYLLPGRMLWLRLGYRWDGGP